MKLGDVVEATSIFGTSSSAVSRKSRPGQEAVSGVVGGMTITSFPLGAGVDSLGPLAATSTGNGAAVSDCSGAAAGSVVVSPGRSSSVSTVGLADRQHPAEQDILGSTGVRPVLQQLVFPQAG